jgi:hypothetical protein
MQYVFDGGFEMHVGDQAIGVRASEWFISKDNVDKALEEAAVWLNAQAKRHYRDSIHLSGGGSDKSKLIEVMHRLYERELNSGIQWPPALSRFGLGARESYSCPAIIPAG